MFTFNNRITRLQFWIYSIVPMSTYFLAYILAADHKMFPFFIIIIAFTIWTGLSVQVNRFHDIGMSGKWVILNIIPYVSIVIFLFLGFKKGSEYSNEYGKNLLIDKET